MKSSSAKEYKLEATVPAAVPVPLTMQNSQRLCSDDFVLIVTRISEGPAAGWRRCRQVWMPFTRSVAWPVSEASHTEEPEHVHRASWRGGIQYFYTLLPEREATLEACCLLGSMLGRDVAKI